MEALCQRHGLLAPEAVIRVPFLVKGRLVLPPALTQAEVEQAFASQPTETGYLKLPHAQLLREPVIDPATRTYSGEYQYQALPALDPVALVETDFSGLAAGLYALRVDEILDFLRLVSDQLQSNWTTLDRVRSLCARVSKHPEPYLTGAFASLAAGLDPEAGRSMIDQELSYWGIPGSRFLNGWEEVPGQVIPGLAPLLAPPGPENGPPSSPGAKTLVRAMPTRQLHITAGNAPQVPLISALRLALTKSAGVIKFPFEATLPGALVSLAALTAAPDHPLTRGLSAVYWQGGDESIENLLLAPGAFDRIVVWGAPQAVTAVQSKALFTKVISFNPRYGASFIGREAFQGNLDQVAYSSALDVMIYNQKACNAAHVQYIEADQEAAAEYARRLAAVLAGWDAAAPQFVPPTQRGQIKRMRRGKYLRSEWFLNTQAGDFASGVVVIPEEFDIFDHPMCRLVVVRPVACLEDALQYLHAGVSMVGVYPEERRQSLRDEIAARGVSSILPLGQCERVYAGMPQDGMRPLSELVDWKNG